MARTHRPRIRMGSWAQWFAGLTALCLMTPTAGRADAITQPAASATAPPMMDYKVQVGDTCSSLAKHLYGDVRRVNLIHRNNDLGPSPHHLRPGQILHVPVLEPAGPKEPDARLTYVRNQVEAYTPEYHLGQKNEALAQGNRVGTLAASSAEISFANETQMQLGEHSMVVIFGDTAPEVGRPRRAAGTEEALLLKGTLRAHLAELSGPATDPKRPPIVVATPGASVELPRQSGEFHLDVDAKKTTRLSVLHGHSKLAAAGKKIEVPVGFGSRADEGRAPTPPRPLPRPPLWTPVPSQLLLGRGAALPIVMTYRADLGGGPPAAQWHRQLARDPSFNDILLDTKVPAAELSWSLGALPAGELYARVSAIDADYFEGQSSAVVHTQVALLQLVPATKTAQAFVVFPRGLFCGLDGGALTATDKAAVLPAQDHKVRCGLKSEPQFAEAAELTVAAADSGTVLAPIQLGPVLWTNIHGERDMSFRLTDVTGAPLAIPVAELQVQTAPGVEVAPLVAKTPGEYRTHLRWTAPITDLGLAVQVRGIQLEAIALAVDPKELEPPRLQPVPLPPGEPRAYFELAAAGSALVNKDAYGFGAGIELGPRIRLPFGSLRIALRFLAEQAITTPSSPDMLNVSGVVTYVFGQPSWRSSPYLGVFTQATVQRVAGTPGLGDMSTNTGLLLGGLAGVQVRLWRGGIFAELGYRSRVAELLPVKAPEWNTAFLLLGYRLSL